MKRRTFLATSSAALAAMTLPASAKASLDALSAYINGISTLEADFAQINPDGSRDNGKLYLRRPGRMRFEYATNDALVMAGGGTVAIFDPKTNVAPEQFPIRRTPLNLILQRNVNLAASGMVIGHSGDATTTRVTARDPKNREAGQIEMVFVNNPLTLAQWTITDQGGGRTTVVLNRIRLGGQMSARLFSITQEIQQRMGG